MGRHKTIKESDIRELHGEGLTNIVIAEILGIAPATVSKRMREMGLERNPTIRRDSKRYAVYDSKTSEFVMEGTLRELAEMFGIKTVTAHSHLRYYRMGKKCRWEFQEVDA